MNKYVVEHFHADTQEWHAYIAVSTKLLAERIAMQRILDTGDDGLGYRVVEVEQ